MAQLKVIDPSLEDSFEEHYELCKTMTKKRSTYSSVGDHRATMSQEKPSKSEAPKLQSLAISDIPVPGLLQVKEVSSIYNADSEDLEEPYGRDL